MAAREGLEDHHRQCQESRLELGCVSAIDFNREESLLQMRTDEGRRFIAHADEKLSAFVELEPQVLTVTFYRASIHVDD
jgi:hypothetical protein